MRGVMPRGTPHLPRAPSPPGKTRPASPEGGREEWRPPPACLPARPHPARLPPDWGLGRKNAPALLAAASQWAAGPSRGGAGPRASREGSRRSAHPPALPEARQWRRPARAPEDGSAAVVARGCCGPAAATSEGPPAGPLAQPSKPPPPGRRRRFCTSCRLCRSVWRGGARSRRGQPERAAGRLLSPARPPTRPPAPRRAPLPPGPSFSPARPPAGRRPVEESPRPALASRILPRTRGAR